MHRPSHDQDNIVNHVPIGAIIQEGRQRLIRLETHQLDMAGLAVRVGTCARMCLQSSTNFCVQRSTIVVVINGDGKSAKYFP